MEIEEAFFILKHGSSEGLHKYLEAIHIIEKENKELKRLLKLAVEDIDYFCKWEHADEAMKLIKGE